MTTIAANPNRMQFIEVDPPAAPDTREPRRVAPEPTVVYIPRLDEREDHAGFAWKTAACAGSLGMVAFLTRLAQHEGAVQAGATGATVAFAATAMVYGVAVAETLLPQVARTVFEVRVAWSAPRVAAHATGQPTRRTASSRAAQAETIERRWKTGARRFLLAARFAGGFGIRRLAYDQVDPHTKEVTRKAMLTDHAWRQYADLWRVLGVLHDYAGKRGLDYAPGFDYARAAATFEEHLRAGRLPLPADASGQKKEPPQVTF